MNKEQKEISDFFPINTARLIGLNRKDYKQKETVPMIATPFFEPLNPKEAKKISSYDEKNDTFLTRLRKRSFPSL